MVVQHNLTAMNSNRMLGLTTKTQAKSTEKLSSGYKINRAADDAAGLSISEKMRKQIRGLTQASLNAQDGISAVQTAEGALTEVHDMLQRMNELAVKAANGTMSEDDREYIQNEIDQLVTEIDRVSETTKFNETYLLKGDKQEADFVEVGGIIGGDAAKVVDGVKVEAKGNIFQATIDDDADTALASGTEDTATIEYKDAEGNTRTKDVVFKTGADAKATAANLAEAINDDAELSKVFKASSDKNGQLSVESKLDGTKTDETKNAVQGITFASADTSTGAAGTARITKFVDDSEDTLAATGGSYELDITKLEDGDSITIDGKTYTFDATKNSVANSFQSIADLQKLLGSDYEVNIELDIEKTTKHFMGDDANKAKANGADTVETVTAGPVSADAAETLITDLDKDSLETALTDDTFAAGDTLAKDETKDAATYGDVKTMKLTITRKAETAKEVNALNFSLQVGADTTAENKISVDIESMSAKSLGIDGLRVDGKDSSNADAAVDVIAEAIQKVSTQRSALGAVQNRLEHTINNLDNVVENTTSAESQIRDTDMASEMVKYSNNNILAQAGQAMLAQANQSNQGVLSLLG